jgi:hypothetical protein
MICNGSLQSCEPSSIETPDNRVLFPVLPALPGNTGIEETVSWSRPECIWNVGGSESYALQVALRDLFQNKTIEDRSPLATTHSKRKCILGPESIPQWHFEHLYCRGVRSLAG